MAAQVGLLFPHANVLARDDQQNSETDSRIQRVIKTIFCHCVLFAGLGSMDRLSERNIGYIRDVYEVYEDAVELTEVFGHFAVVRSIRDWIVPQPHAPVNVLISLFLIADSCRALSRILPLTHFTFSSPLLYFCLVGELFAHALQIWNEYPVAMDFIEDMSHYRTMAQIRMQPSVHTPLSEIQDHLGHPGNEDVNRNSIQNYFRSRLSTMSPDLFVQAIGQFTPLNEIFLYRHASQEQKDSILTPRLRQIKIDFQNFEAARQFIEEAQGQVSQDMALADAEHLLRELSTRVDQLTRLDTYFDSLARAYGTGLRTSWVELNLFYRINSGWNQLRVNPYASHRIQASTVRQVLVGKIQRLQAVPREEEGLAPEDDPLFTDILPYGTPEYQQLCDHYQLRDDGSPIQAVIDFLRGKGVTTIGHLTREGIWQVGPGNDNNWPQFLQRMTTRFPRATSFRAKLQFGLIDLARAVQQVAYKAMVLSYIGSIFYFYSSDPNQRRAFWISFGISVGVPKVIKTIESWLNWSALPMRHELYIRSLSLSGRFSLLHTSTLIASLYALHNRLGTDSRTHTIFTGYFFAKYVSHVYQQRAF